MLSNAQKKKREKTSVKTMASYTLAVATMGGQRKPSGPKGKVGSNLVMVHIGLMS